MKKLFNRPIFWILLASVLPVLSLLHPGMPFVHDGQDHAARIANFYAALKEGIVVPRWAANLNWGYGHPILMFLYPLPEYFAGAFHALGFTLVDSTKLVFGFAFIASAAAMYLWMSGTFGEAAGAVGALLYSFAPYRFVDLHVRGALGEHVAFIFPPLILYFLRKRSYIGFAVALAALILSHNAIALMFVPIVGLYALYLMLFESKDKISFAVNGLLFTILGFGLSAFFWVPAILEGKFTLRDIVTAGEALRRFVPWFWFVYSPWNYGGTDTLTKSLGIAQWIGIMGALYLLFRTKQKKLKVMTGGGFILLLTSLFIQTQASAPIWHTSKLLQVFQFPWRLLSVSVFVAAVLGGISVPLVADIFASKFGLKRKVLVIGCCLFIIGVTWFMWYPKGYQVHEDPFYSGVYPGTTDTGESSPVWSVRFMEHAAAGPLEVIDGDATVIADKRKTTEHNYLVTVRRPTLMKENTLYFPGWKIYVNGLPVDIEWQNPTYRGLMTFRVTPGDNQAVRVVFEDTKVRKSANWISIISLALTALTGVGGFVWQKRK